MGTKKPTKFYSASEAADAVGCSIGTVYSWCHSGRYPSRSYGVRGVLIERATVREMAKDYRAWRADVARRKKQNIRQQSSVGRQRRAKRK